MSKIDRELLQKQILRDSKDGDTTVLAEIIESLDEGHVFDWLSDANQEATNWQQLKGEERIEALVNTRGVSNSYNTPEHIDIKTGTILVCPNTGTRMGDAFARFVQGEAIKDCRGHNEGEKQEQKRGDVVGLSGGYKSAPYSLGKIDLRIWKIV